MELVPDSVYPPGSSNSWVVSGTSTTVEKANSVFSHCSTFQSRCSHSKWMPHCCIVFPQCFPGLYILCTDAFLIYSFTFIAQLNDYVFVSYNCQKDLMRLQSTKVLMCYLKLYKAVLINVNRWQASSCDCKCSLHLYSAADWLVGSVLWLCQVHQRLPGVNCTKAWLSVHNVLKPSP